VTREEAERERDRLAEEQPDSTWLVAEQEPGRWSVVKVGLKPSKPDPVPETESRPRPPNADDTRPRHDPNWGF
jgi:hypothetical protein